MRWIPLVVLVAILSGGCGGDPPKGAGEPAPFPDRQAGSDANHPKSGPGFK